jgi:hypothetical protein
MDYHAILGQPRSELHGFANETDFQLIDDEDLYDHFQYLLESVRKLYNP